MVVKGRSEALGNEYGLTVLSLSMADEDALFRRRQGFWLRMAREAKGLNQLGAAGLVGLVSQGPMAGISRSSLNHGRTR